MFPLWWVMIPCSTQHSQDPDPQTQHIPIITLHVTGIYAYIEPANHLNVGIYSSPMECMGYGVDRDIGST